MTPDRKRAELVARIDHYTQKGFLPSQEAFEQLLATGVMATHDFVIESTNPHGYTNILLVRRAIKPYKWGLALPGIRQFRMEPEEWAVRRILYKELGLDPLDFDPAKLHQLGVAEAMFKQRHDRSTGWCYQLKQSERVATNPQTYIPGSELYVPYPRLNEAINEDPMGSIYKRHLHSYLDKKQKGHF